MRTSIQGLQDAQAAMLRAADATKPTGPLGEAVRVLLAHLHRYAVSITHVQTGALRASHYLDVSRAGVGSIYINPAATSPSGEKPSVYGVGEHAKGGEHAFYQRAVTEDAQAAWSAAQSVLKRALR